MQHTIEILLPIFGFIVCGYGAGRFRLINDDGTENPALVVFRRDGDEVRLFWKSEMRMEMADPGQDPRDAPDIAPLWSILDLTPDGRAPDWYPRLRY